MRLEQIKNKNKCVGREEATRLTASRNRGRWKGWAGRRGFARKQMSSTVSTKDDAPREELFMSSGQAPFFAATPGAHDGQAAPACTPGTVRVTPATLTETSLTDGSNAPSLGPIGMTS